MLRILRIRCHEHLTSASATAAVSLQRKVLAHLKEQVEAHLMNQAGRAQLMEQVGRIHLMEWTGTGEGRQCDVDVVVE
jgi:hypothetical protein